MNPIDQMSVVRDVVAKLERAWNDADGAGFGSAFTPDADFVDIRGSHHRGADAIGHGHQAIFDTIYAGSTLGYSATTAAQVADELVLGIVDSTLDAPSGPLQASTAPRPPCSWSRTPAPGRFGRSTTPSSPAECSRSDVSPNLPDANRRQAASSVPPFTPSCGGGTPGLLAALTVDASGL